jgi:hypothetical protein
LLIVFTSALSSTDDRRQAPTELAIFQKADFGLEQFSVARNRISKPATIDLPTSGLPFRNRWCLVRLRVADDRPRMSNSA